MIGPAQLKLLRTILEPEDYRRFALLFVAALVSVVLEVIGVASIMPFMELVARPEVLEERQWLAGLYEFVGISSRKQMLLWTGAVVFVLFSTSVVVALVLSWFVQHIVWITVHHMCVRQLKIYMQLPYEFFLGTSSTELLRRIVSDINSFQADVLLAGSHLLAQAILAAGLLALLLLVNPALSLTVIVVFGSSYVLLHWLRHSYLVDLGQRRMRLDNRRYTALVEAIGGMKAIRVAGAERYFVDRFDAASSDFAHLFPRLQLVTRFPQSVMQILAFGGIILVVLYFVAVEDNFANALPMLTLFALATYRLMPALHNVFESAAKLSTSVPIIESLARDMSLDERFESLPETTDAAVRFEREIRLHGVAFRYAAAKGPTLAGIDIRIGKGESAALVGATGSGKTTLVDILVGLLAPRGGGLEVDGAAIGPRELAAWRRLIAYVPQDGFLYDASVADNIAFGAPDAIRDQARLHQVAKAVRIHEFISGELPHGYDTLIGERGVRLSGGQRQRLALARALYSRPQVLVLDEATSALDGITEASVMTTIRESMPGLTVIMVAHRLSTVRLCDRIYLIEKGRLGAQGTYDQLYRSNSVFRQMVESSQHQAQA